MASGEQVEARKLRQQKDDSSPVTSSSGVSPSASASVSVYQSFRCCNSTLVLEQYISLFGEGCAGEPFFSFPISTDQIPDCTNNYQMRCPAGGTGNPFLRAYGNGTYYLPSGSLKRVQLF
jgi:hypothetical protein